MSDVKYLYFPPPTPYQGVSPCPTCRGDGITGERYEMLVSETVMILVDEICPECEGCGNGNLHAGCEAKSHAEWGFDYDDLDDYHEGEWRPDGEPEPACPSCHGREWNVVQGIRGEDDNPEMVLLRVACGCVENFMQEVPQAWVTHSDLHIDTKR